MTRQLPITTAPSPCSPVLRRLTKDGAMHCSGSAIIRRRSLPMIGPSPSIPGWAAYGTIAGVALQNLRQLEAAEASFQRAVDLEPSQAGPRVNQALLYLLQEDFSRGWPALAWVQET